jgi:protein TonB
MESQNQIIENFNELVFEKRNKAYGAYILRRSYTNNVSFSLLLSIVFFGCIALAALAFTRSSVPALTKKYFIIDTIQTVSILVELPHPEPKTVEPKKKVETPKLHSDDRNFVVTDKKVETDLKTDEKLVITKFGTTDGKDTVAKTDIPIDVPTKKVEEKNDPLPFVSEMPEFYGNVFQYLADNLHYPRIAVENGTEGQVGLSFVIEKDGNVGDIKVLKGLADGCTEEAIRVVKGMPKWKPGKNHGDLVRVQFNLPVKFRLK